MRERTLRLRPADRGTWEAIVQADDRAVAYHGWDWLDLQEAVLGVAFQRLVVESEGVAVGVFPVPRRSPRSMRSFAPPFPFLGPVVAEPLLADTLRAFRRWQTTSGLVLGHCELGPLLVDGASGALSESGWTFRELDTVVVDLRHGSPDELFASFGKMRRRGIRRALRDGASVRVARPGELAQLLPRLMEEAYPAHEATNPYPEHTGALVEKWAEGREDVAVFTGLVHDDVAGVLVALAGHPTALAWVGTCLRQFRGVDVNAMLYQAVLEWAMEQGCARMDLSGAVDDGVRRFKLAFGGEARPYLVAESSLAPSGLLSTARKVRRRVTG